MKKQILWWILASAFCLLSLLEASAQRIVAQITTNTEKLTQDAKDKLSGILDQLTRYMNDYQWSNNSAGYDILVQVDIFFERAQIASYEDRYDARLVMATQGDYHASDKRWQFPYQQGVQLAHSEQFNALTSVLDFYIYILLAQEYDKITKLGGTAYYQKAFQVAQLSKFTEFFTLGWKERLDHIEKLQMDSQIPLRELEYFLAQARNRLRIDDRKTSEQYLRAILLRLHNLGPEAEGTIRFYELHHLDLAQMMAAMNMRLQLEELAALDSTHAVTYQEFLKQSGP